MAPHAPRPSEAPPIGPGRGPPAREEPPPPPPRGPPPGTTVVPNQYSTEQDLRRMQKLVGCDPVREDTYRLQGIQLIDTVRLALRLPVKTFNTACTYYHMFRICFRDAEYNFQDAALTSLFVACKVEDTIKKSKEILCAAYNIKNPDHTTTQDDKMFDQPLKIVIGLERHILQTIGFDFRVRHPQKYLAKIVRKLLPPQDGKEFMGLAYLMCTDMYKTFAPVKQTTSTMVMAIVELTALLTEKHVDAVRSAPDLPGLSFQTERGSVVETMLDLLDLYTVYQKHTKIGPRFETQRFLDIKISLNKEVDGSRAMERFQHTCGRCEQDERDANPFLATPGSVTSPATTGSGANGGGGGAQPAAGSIRRRAHQEGTQRFAFDAEQVRREKEATDDFFREEYEEYEIEVDEEVREPSSSSHRQNSHGNHHGGGGGGGSGGGGNHGRGHGSRRDRNNHHESDWPYPRGRHGHDRPKGRKGGGGGGGGGGGRGGGYYNH